MEKTEFDSKLPHEKEFLLKSIWLRYAYNFDEPKLTTYTFYVNNFNIMQAFYTAI